MLAVVALLCGLAVPVFATGVFYNPEDYIDSVAVSGNEKTVTYTFEGVSPVTDIYLNDSMVGSKTGAFSNTFFSHGDFGELLFSTYLLGVSGFADEDAWSGVIDVSDIMPYADLNVTGSYHVTISYNNTPSGDVVCRWRWGFLCYDANLHYVKTDYTPFTTTTLPGGGGANGYVLDVTSSYTIPSNVAYIMPVVQSIWTVGDTTFHDDGIDFHVTPYPFSMSCDIDMIYEQSNTMQAVKDELEKLNDKQSQTNDKLDTIISGTEEQQQQADDFKDKAEDTMGDLESAGDAMENVPVPDIEVDELIPSEHLLGTSYLAYVNVISTIWDNDTILTMVSIMVAIALISYLIFAKKG